MWSRTALPKSSGPSRYLEQFDEKLIKMMSKKTTRTNQLEELIQRMMEPYEKIEAILEKYR